jgi:hypothetical protein
MDLDQVGQSSVDHICVKLKIFGRKFRGGPKENKLSILQWVCTLTSSDFQIWFSTRFSNFATKLSTSVPPALYFRINLKRGELRFLSQV